MSKLPEDGPYGFEILCLLNGIQHCKESLEWARDMKRWRRSNGTSIEKLAELEDSWSEELYKLEDELKEFRDKHFYWMRKNMKNESGEI